MKRTGELKRKTPLKRSAIRRKEAMTPRLSVTTLPLRKPMKRYRRDSATIKADKLWGELVHARGVCAAAGSGRCEGPLEAHHAHPLRRSRRVRWRLETSLLLCRGHHGGSEFSAHGTPKLWKIWMQRHHPAILVAHRELETPREALARLEKQG